MRRKTLALAVTALLVFGASSAVAAPVLLESTGTAHQVPSNAVSSDTHTVEVIDPYNKLTANEAEKAWQLAYTNETVQRYFGDRDSLHFHVEAEGSEVQVYVAKNETAPPRVKAVVSLDSGAVTTVESIDNVVHPDEVSVGRLSDSKKNVTTGEQFAVHASPENDTGERDPMKPGETFTGEVTGDDSFVVNDTE
ncbi:hypothetical protein E6P09_15900 (plasmid) [Haloferax mediterranei ATCC 33500]|uniref:Uncharacterized protein n=1 Tax=Haloferax mediterranei (strain ATCC 33500 / DSM 1411 / JCM 8866 / NBRC 14739 / NCIMB 2177 / R-4) TaxID=523841 RepID=I3RBC1_HALMT|nr:hypothetical protein [Haloferax mediterranei]AFK21531.1 hypothetical protein HFX_6412 [Haloferax mediterranei ATCC 33500]AHZ24416.1 hypothetical protein BM92_15980 [Haloferax mediterranei ATCC 33500]ELZ97156.1 hypothetical protein C439_17578 [Haloferax mediterranei ATCC 33500]MDX5990100.1 hypothetical protein [Haloferax mediterranei ATCC 33500]QCQ76815.1 hypothetical protein E6P09_15900 [Haloferax mediterranei ATCC 33500]